MPSRLILFAPGAGAPSTSPWMRRWAEHLAVLGRVVPFDYPYMLARRRSPDRLPTLIEAHRRAFAQASRLSDGPAVLIGKSMGSRVGCHVAANEPGVAALVCLGYPLRAPDGKIREEALLALDRPILFVRGSRDPLCPASELERVRQTMRAPSAVTVVEGGNHSLEVGKRSLAERQSSQADVERRVLEVIQEFMQRWASAVTEPSPAGS